MWASTNRNMKGKKELRSGEKSRIGIRQGIRKDGKPFGLKSCPLSAYRL
jgi:hypothetical protein